MTHGKRIRMKHNLLKMASKKWEEHLPKGVYTDREKTLMYRNFVKGFKTCWNILKKIMPDKI